MFTVQKIYTGSQRLIYFVTSGTYYRFLADTERGVVCMYI